MSAKAIAKGFVAAVVFFATCGAMFLFLEWLDDPTLVLVGAGFLMVWFIASVQFDRPRR